MPLSRTLIEKIFDSLEYATLDQAALVIDEWKTHKASIAKSNAEASQASALPEPETPMVQQEEVATAEVVDETSLAVVLLAGVPLKDNHIYEARTA